MCNLLQNPSFEVGLNGWEFNNVSLESSFAFEGTQAALLNTGIASIYQDVIFLEGVNRPLLLSFAALSLYENLVRPERGALVVEVIWQNGAGNPIGTGLRLLIPTHMLVDNNNRLTYVEVTDRPPTNAVRARLQFSKAALVLGNNPIIIDNVILAPVVDINMITNPGFQERLFDWTSINAGASGLRPYEGTINAVINSTEVGNIYQDVPISSLPANSSFLLSFAARRETTGDDLLVKVDYRNGVGSLGIGLNLLIPASALNQTGWKTYAVATTIVAPVGTTIARVSFEGTTPNVSTLVDNVILTMVKTPNLILNPSFEGDLSNWTSENVIATTSGDEYEGEWHARASSSSYIFQDVNIEQPGCCYLLTFGAQGIIDSDALAEVIWLNADKREIGLGTSLVIPQFALFTESPSGGPPSLVWALFASVTEQSPPGATAARVLFTVPASSTIEIDLVSFTSMICTTPPPARGVKYQDVFK